MKHTLPVLVLIFFSTFQANAQVYAINNGFANGGTIKTCSGLFKDSNPFGIYNANETYTVTFLPANASNQVMQIVFDTLDIAAGDTLFVYDGVTTSATLITDLTNKDGAPFSIRATASNTSGGLTFKFVSNGSQEGRGWNATVNCKSACQPINVKLTSIPAADANGFIDICKGQEITFTGSGQYPLNNKYYHQSDTISRFLWSFSDRKDTSGIFLSSVTRKFDKEGGAFVQLSLVDANECYNLLPVQVKVRNSLTPTFNINPVPICINDTLKLTASPVFPKGNFVTLPVNAESKPLPDGKGVCYETSINITSFLPGQTLNSLNELEGILVNMEHSWLGDITIAITAPNKSKVYLKRSGGTANDWGAYLGEPVDEPSVNSPIYDSISKMTGYGYDYLFAPKPQFGTMMAERTNHRYTYTNRAGQVQSNHPYLPEGSYSSEESLAGLIGTSLNGLWTLEVCDLYKEDNGHIFYWTIKVNASAYPNPEEYSRTIGTQQWQTAPGLTSSNANVAVISPATPGNFDYTYLLTDDIGCRFDTTVTVRVNSLPSASGLPAQGVLCADQPLTLAVSNPQLNHTYSWSTGATNVSTVSVNQPGKYTVTGQNTQGCKRSDTITVINSTPASITLQPILYCASSTNSLTPVVSGNIASYLWNTGATTQIVEITSAGSYTITATTNQGCKIAASVIVSNNPVNAFALPADTTICAGTNYQLSLKVPPATQLLWDDGSTSPLKTIVSGSYKIEAVNQGCKKSDDFIVGTRPIPIVRVGADTVLCVGFDVTLTANYPGASYLWSTGSRDNKIVAKNAGVYWVEAALNNCTYRDSVQVQQITCDCNVKLPNAFSPNGDGINDTFRPEIGCFPKDYHFSVFNRYGQLVYDTKVYTEFWAGTSNGNPLPVGTYYYILSFYNITLQKTEVRKGGITLLK